MPAPVTGVRTGGVARGDSAGVRHRPPSGNLLVAVVGGLAALAAVALWVWGSFPYARYLSHGSPVSPASPALALAVFVLGWALMIVAMMLPSALPLLRAFAVVTRLRPNRARLQVVLVSAFLGVWVLFGVAVYRADLVLHELIDRVGWLGDRPEWVAAGVLLVAGLYQLSELRRRCLSRCQSPAGFISRFWTGDRPALAAGRIGADYGLFCLGCCWALMLLMFALGTANVALMLVLGGLMAVEKNVPRARSLVAPLGPLLLAAGAALAFSGTVG